MDNGNVCKTLDYELFKFNKLNRNVNEKNVNKIGKSVKKYGWKPYPILVNSAYEVIDGQHRLVYAKQHNLPVYYVVVNGITSNDCQIMNTTRTSWTVDDYVHYYASQGNASFILLSRLRDEFSFITTGMITTLLTVSAYGGTQNTKIKDGSLELTFSQYENIREILNFIKPLTPYITTTGGRVTAIYIAIAFCYNNQNVNNKKLADAIKKRIATISPPANLEWALKAIEEIYNYNSRDPHVYIYTEYKKFIEEKRKK